MTERLVDEKWAQYPCTVLEFLVPRAPRIDLRRPLGLAERGILEELDLARPFAIFTAENPWGEHVEDAPTEDAEQAAARRNAERRTRLEEELRDAGIRFIRCDGVAPDGDYREHAVAALLPRDDAVAIAKRYRQLAIFWFDGARFWLVAALAEKADEPLPA